MIWFSSGNTRSVLHADMEDNIHCVLDGKDEFFLIDKVCLWCCICQFDSGSAIIYDVLSAIKPV
jgi:hypothetical protein